MAKVTVEGTGNWEELTDFKFKIDRKNITLTRSFKIPNIDDGEIDTTNAAIFDFLGDCFPNNQITPGRFINTSFRAYVDTVDIVPFQGEESRSICGSDGEGDVAAYEAYKATVSYARLDYGDGGNGGESEDEPDDPETGNAEIAKITRTFGTDTLLKPDWAMKWETGDPNDPVPDGFLATQVVPFIEYRIEYPRIRKSMVPEAKIAELAGHVNKNKFSDTNKLFPGADAESVLFVGADTTNTAHATGELRQTLGLTFRRRLLKNEAGEGIGWNHIYRPNPGSGKTWDRLLTEVPDGDTSYPLANSFYPLFNIKF
ncbi:hypothetical protein [Kordiimonas sp.]|uniref:hypothetical protein n=1 Tax=Kordiimonas sp. TaxID=1970157 RepID=UPI003A953912